MGAATGSRVERARHILDLSLSLSWRRKGKTVALFLVYALVVFLTTSVLFLADALRQMSSVLLRGAPEMVVQRIVMGRHDLLPPSYGEEIRKIPGVAAARGRLWGYYYDPGSQANYSFMVPASPMPEGTMSLGDGISRDRHAYEGDIMSFRTFAGKTMSLVVDRVLPEESGLLTADLILVSERDFRDLFGVPEGYYTDLAVSAGSPAESAAVAGEIPERLKDARVTRREDMLQTYAELFDWRGGILAVVLAFSALSFIILAWDRASGLTAAERREIGVLRATGWEKSDVLLLKLCEGAVVSLPAFLAGTLLAYAHVFPGKAFLLTPALQGWSTLYPEFLLTPVLRADRIALLFCLTVVPYSLISAAAARRAASADPDGVMR